MFLLDVGADAFHDRVKLAVAGAGANHEVVGDQGDIAQVQQDDVFPFNILNLADDRAGQVYRFQKQPPSYKSAIE